MNKTNKRKSKIRNLNELNNAIRRAEIRDGKLTPVGRAELRAIDQYGAIIDQDLRDLKAGKASVAQKRRLRELINHFDRKN
jgi:hypothetical protein